MRNDASRSCIPFSECMLLHLNGSWAHTVRPMAPAFILRMRAALVNGDLALVPTDCHSLDLGPGILPKPPGMCPLTSPPMESAWAGWSTPAGKFFFFSILGSYSTDVNEKEWGRRGPNSRRFRPISRGVETQISRFRPVPWSVRFSLLGKYSMFPPSFRPHFVR